MKNNKVLLVLLVFGLLFLGCGDNSDPNDQDNPNNNNGNNGNNNNNSGNGNNNTANSLVEFLGSLKENAQSGGSYSYVIKADETIDPQDLLYNDKMNITITLTGDNVIRTVRLSPTARGAMFIVRSDVTLNLGNNLTLEGHSFNNSPLITIAGGGTLIMNTGSKITGNTNSSAGGGVGVSSAFSGPGGKFIMNDGEISNNRSTGGGGAAISSGATFLMKNGKIINNTVVGQNSGSGGGVLAYGTFIMDNGEISNNSVSSLMGVTQSVGGGVYVLQASFSMNGGKINGNSVSALGSTSSATGGGVSVNGNSSYPGIFTMTGGEISGNTVSSGLLRRGGGVYMDSNTSFIKTGGIITGSNDVNAPNIINNNSGVIQDNNGHAVYVSNPIRRRETTAGAAVNMDLSIAGTAGGWEN